MRFIIDTATDPAGWSGAYTAKGQIIARLDGDHDRHVKRARITAIRDAMATSDAMELQAIIERAQSAVLGTPDLRERIEALSCWSALRLEVDPGIVNDVLARVLAVVEDEAVSRETAARRIYEQCGHDTIDWDNLGGSEQQRYLRAADAAAGMTDD